MPQLSVFKQLRIGIIEYLLHKGSLVEHEYINILESYYKYIISARPERYVFTSQDLLSLIEAQARLSLFNEVQHDLYELLQMYKEEDKS